jgi:hypothetical protein
MFADQMMQERGLARAEKSSNQGHGQAAIHAKR